MTSEIDTRAIVILATAPADGGHAQRLAHGLVESRLAACVNIISGVTSVYRYKDEIQEDAEVQLVIKTAPDRFEAVAAWLAEHHPYDVPEVLALSVSAGASAYLDWLAAQTTVAD